MFINPEIAMDRVNCGMPYIIGPTPLVIYTADDCRVQVNSASPAQLSVSRKSPGLLGSKYCLELVTTVSKGAVASDDNDNLERWIDPVDIRKAKWGTPHAQPLTVSFDAEAAIAGDHSVAFIDWSDSVFCVGKFTLQAGGVAQRVAITFPAMTGGDWSQGGKFLTDLGSGDSFTTGVEGQWLSGHAWHLAGTQRLTMQPVGSYLRLGNYQADEGMVALPFRYIDMAQQLADCNRFLWSTFPEGTAINNAGRGGAAGIEGAIKLLVTSQPSAAGLLAPVRFPVEMALVPNLYSFSPRFLNDHNWYRANGDFSSGAPDFWGNCANGVDVHYPNTNDPNGSLVYLHLVACAQRGGNGVLPSL